MAKHLFTSESVTEGHPDKICDNISDAVLDAILAQDPDGRVACETTCITDQIMVMGEITTKAKIDIVKCNVKVTFVQSSDFFINRFFNNQTGSGHR